ncbi:site-specific DNA-methyltransferase [Paenibacillus sp. FSL M7-1455]|uniref:DNA-methyltransferase n=1 Tax=Paenibacillus sp. FSL M7-1455 TaxID=2975316 RepID=UPI0030F63AF5
MTKEIIGSIELNRIYQMDCRDGMKLIPNGSVDLVVTSPPYNIGKEYEKKQPLEAYVYWMMQIIDECVRLISDNGSIVFQVGNYVNDGAVYPLDCILFPEFAKRGLIPRNRIVWTFGHGLHCTKRFSGRYETALWFTKTDDYVFNLDAVRVPQKYPNKKHYKGDRKGELSGNPLGKNPSDVWEISNVKHNHPEKTDHPCQFPLDFANRIILSLSNEGGVVLDPFMGSGTTAVGAVAHQRKFIGFETEPKYIEIANKRLDSIFHPESSIPEKR